MCSSKVLIAKLSESLMWVLWVSCRYQHKVRGILEKKVGNKEREPISHLNNKYLVENIADEY